MNPSFGETFHEIRQSKHLTMDKIAGRKVSKAQISRFEKGQSELSVDKFFYLLQQMRVGLDEFESLHENFSLSEDYQFRRNLSLAYDAKDAPRLRKMYVTCQKKCQASDANVYDFLTATVVKATLNLVVGNINFPAEEVKRLENYLLQVDNWGRFELWLFCNAMSVLKPKVRNSLGKALVGRTEFYDILPVNQRLVIRTFYNLVFHNLEEGSLNTALNFLSHLEHLDISIDFLYEKLAIKYLKGRIAFAKGNLQGLDEIQQCIDILSELGCRAKARTYQVELTQLKAVADMQK